MIVGSGTIHYLGWLFQSHSCRETMPSHSSSSTNNIAHNHLSVNGIKCRLHRNRNPEPPLSKSELDSKTRPNAHECSQREREARSFCLFGFVTADTVAKSTRCFGRRLRSHLFGYVVVVVVVGESMLTMSDIY
jgi:hypothetical protein